MKKTLSLLMVIFLTLNLYAQEKILTALKINNPIKIDGILDESIWQQAQVADSFIVNSPNFGAKAAQATKVRILYSDQAIYVGAYLYDNPKLMRKQLTARDRE